MKKVITAFSLIVILLAFTDPKERYYTIQIPEKLINPYWQVIHGQGDELKVGEYKELMTLLENSLRQQADKFKLEDSLGRKKDTLIKPKK